jgi:hypothetical protein
MRSLRRYLLLIVGLSLLACVVAVVRDSPENEHPV